MRVKQPLRVDGDEFPDQFAERRAGHRLDGKNRCAATVGQLVGLKRQPRHDTKRPASAALEGPEQLGVSAGISDAHLAVGGHHFGFEQRRRRGSVVLRKAAEPAALDEPGDADRGASAALDIAPGLGRHRVVDMKPDRPGADQHRRLRRRAAAHRDEILMQGDIVHRPRPDQQRVGCV